LLLTPYSPGFSPIEEAFSKVKARLRRWKARPKEALVGAIGRALEAVSAPDTKSWFAH
jgi:transposase